MFDGLTIVVLLLVILMLAGLAIHYSEGQPSGPPTKPPNNVVLWPDVQKRNQGEPRPPLPGEASRQQRATDTWRNDQTIGVQHSEDRRAASGEDWRLY